MMNRSEYQRNHPNLHEGMIAYTRDGREIGRVVELADDSLTVGGGVYFPRDFTIRYDDIAEERADAIVLAYQEPELHEWREADYSGWHEYERRNVVGVEVRGVEVREADTEPEPREGRYVEGEEPVEAREVPLEAREVPLETREVPLETREVPLETREDVQIPLYEEQIETRKVARSMGEVRVRKVVHTEIRHIEVPVTREEIVVERRPAEGGDVEGDAAAFQGEETRIPIMEEEVEIHKRQVKKEDVSIRKEKHVEHREIREEVRSEDVEIDGPEKADPEEDA